MVSTKFVVACVVVLFAAVQARVSDRYSQYGGQRGGNGFVRGGGQGGQQNGIGGGQGGSYNYRNCQAPTNFPSMISNATIAQVQALWTANVNTTNCSSTLQQEQTIIQAAIEQFVVNLAQTNLSAAAQPIFNQMKAAYDAMETAENAYDAAPANVQTELQTFDRTVSMMMMSGGGGRPGMAGNFQSNGGQGNFGNGQGFGRK